MTDITMKLICPRAPNFILVDDMQKRKRQDGIVESPKVPVSMLTDEQKDQLAAEWRSSLDAVAERQRKGES
ncbi:hypothetical protein ABWH92_12185 [Ahrensia marina]|uniref:hypothetical protein n=1 Tax=Ahrensia marina TaxID=1514904 RepID=UPI0035CF05E4